MIKGSKALMTGLSTAALAVAALCAPVAAQAASNDKVRVIVAYKATAAAEKNTRAALAAAGAKVYADLKDVRALAVVLPASAVAKFKSDANVEYVESEVTRRIMGSVSNRRAAPSAVAGTQTTPYGITMVQADQVSDSAAAGRKLCIIDSGFNATHEDLPKTGVTGENFTTSGSWNTDESSHGTHVAGTIAAVSNSVGVVGVLPNSKLKLHIAKVFDAAGSASSVTIAKAMLACGKAGANVVSMSLGGSSAAKIEQTAAKWLAGKNILVIAAAGNAGTSAVSYPAGFSEVMSVAAVDSSKAWATFSQFNSDVEIAAPGVAVLSTVPSGSQLGATTSVGGVSFDVLGMSESPLLTATGALADFGLGDVASPGSMTGKVCLISRGNISFADKVLNCQSSGGVGAIIYNNTTGPLAGTMGETVTTIPSVGATQADGATMLTKLGQSASVSVHTTTDLYAAYNGTSMATPHASAVAALVWSHFPSCTAAQMRSTLTKSAQDLGAAGRDVYFGYGLIQAKAAYDRIATLGCGN